MAPHEEVPAREGVPVRKECRSAMRKRRTEGMAPASAEVTDSSHPGAAHMRGAAAETAAHMHGAAAEAAAMSTFLGERRCGRHYEHCCDSRNKRYLA